MKGFGCSPAKGRGFSEKAQEEHRGREIFTHSCVNAAGIGQAEVELSGDSLVGGLPTALLCLPFSSDCARGHVSSDAI